MKQDQSASWVILALAFVSTCLYGMATQGGKDAVLFYGGALVAAPFALAVAMLFWHGLVALWRALPNIDYVGRCQQQQVEETMRLRRYRDSLNGRG